MADISNMPLNIVNLYSRVICTKKQYTIDQADVIYYAQFMEKLCLSKNLIYGRLWFAAGV